MKAKINYNIKINQAPSSPAIPSKTWWGIVESECYSAIPAVCERDVFTSDPNTKANVFNDYFASQATIPSNDSTEVSFFSRWSPDSLSVITVDEQMFRHLYLL